MTVERNVKVLTWFNFFTDLKLYAPVAIIYFASVSHSFALGMSIFSLAMISSAIFEIPTGVFSDMIGRRKTVMFGALSAVLFSIFYAIGNFYWVLVIGALFEGLSRSFYSGNNDALLYDTLNETGKKETYAHIFGRITSMFQIALAVSSIFGGVIANFSFALVMWLSIIPQLICLILSFKLVEPSIESKKSGNIYVHLKESLIYLVKNIKLRDLSIASILSSSLGEASFLFQSAFYNTLWPLWAIGIVKALSFGGATLSFFFSGKIINKLNPIRTVIVGNIYSRILNIVATAFPTIISPILMSSTSLFYGASEVAKSTLFQKEFTDKQRATLASIKSLGESLVFGIISIGVGLIGDKLGPAKSLLILQLFAFPVVILYWRIFKKDSLNGT